MPEISFACPSCNQHLEAPAEMAGAAVECPTCNQAITVPAAGPAAPAAPQANVCPSCNAEMQPGAVLCVSCGFHTKLGKKITTEFS